MHPSFDGGNILSRDNDWESEDEFAASAWTRTGC
jgi:hypothetical protein